MGHTPFDYWFNIVGGATAAHGVESATQEELQQWQTSAEQGETDTQVKSGIDKKIRFVGVYNRKFEDDFRKSQAEKWEKYQKKLKEWMPWMRCFSISLVIAIAVAPKKRTA